MSELSTMADTEIVDLATRLRNLHWSWDLVDFPGLATEFGWNVVSIRESWVRFDCGFGRTSGKAQAQVIDLTVTGFATTDDAGLDAVHDAFARMTAELTAAFGEPTTRIPGATNEVRWAGPETTLRLWKGPIAVTLSLVTNERMARTDELIELQRQGLL